MCECIGRHCRMADGAFFESARKTLKHNKFYRIIFLSAFSDCVRAVVAASAIRSAVAFRIAIYQLVKMKTAAKDPQSYRIELLIVTIRMTASKLTMTPTISAAKPVPIAAARSV